MSTPLCRITGLLLDKTPGRDKLDHLLYEAGFVKYG